MQKSLASLHLIVQSCVDESIIVKACGDAACNAASLYAGPVTANLQPNNASASWSGTGVVGSTLDFSGGSAAVNLRYSTAGSITLGLTATPTPINGVACYTPAGLATSCAMTVTACASQLVNACEGTSCNCTSASCTANYDRLFTKVAGNAMSFGLVALKQVSGAYVLDTGFNGTVQVDLVANQSAGACPTPTSAAGLPSSSQSLTFNAGRPVSSGVYTYAVANNLTPYRNLRLRFTQGSPASSTCSLDNFANRPASFAVTSTNATNNGATGTPTFKAGVDNFSLTATAVAGYDGTPLIDNAQLVGTPTAGTITGGFPAATLATGIATGNTLTYSEAGNLGLLANAVYDDSWTAVDQPSDCTNDASNTLVGGKYGCKIGSLAVAQTTGSSGFGRFVPNHFVLSGGSVTPGCGVFSYMDQPFDINFTLTAVNVSGDTTKNYAGGYGKLDPVNTTFWPSSTLGATGFGLGATNSGVDLSPRLTLVGTPSGAWANGVGAFSANLTLNRPTSLTTVTTWGPYNALDIGIAPQDSDNTKLLPAALNLDASLPAGLERQKLQTTSSIHRFGRIRLQNGFGSEKQSLAVPIQAQYWAGSSFVKNVDDSCTPLTGALTRIYSTDVRNKLVSPTPSASFKTVLAPAVATTKLENGTANLVFDPPNLSGWLDLILEVPDYLRYNWGNCSGQTGADSTHLTNNPCARAAFGVYNSKSPIIYRRENY